MSFYPGVAIGTAWPLITFNDSSYIEIKVTAQEDEVIFGGDELTRTYRLQYKDSLGADSTHVFNGKEFKITYNYGFNQTYNLWLFPTDTTALRIAGAPAIHLGFGNTDSRTIFNIQPGNELHYKTYEEFCGFSGCRKETTEEARFYLGRHFSDNEDTLVLPYRRVGITEIDDPVTGLETLSFIDTQQQRIIFSQLGYLEGFNREDFHADSIIGTFCSCPTHGWALITFNDSLGPRPRKRLFIDLELDTANQCLYPSPNTGYDSTFIEYGDGLGLTRFYDTDNSIWWKQVDLVYYQKGREFWGEPFDFTALNASAYLPQKRLKLFPNPVKDVLHIEMDSEVPVTVEVVDAMSRPMRSVSGKGGIVDLDVHDLAQGAYFVRVVSGNQAATQRFVKL